MSKNVIHSIKLTLYCCVQHLLNGFKGIDFGILKIFLLLYADYIVIMAETEGRGPGKGLNLLEHIVIGRN